MRNMKVSRKLLLGFGLIIVFTIAIGASGIFGMSTISSAGNELYYEQTEPLGIIANIISNLQQARIQIRNLAINTGDTENIAALDAEAKRLTSSLGELIPEYEKTIEGTETLKLFNEAKSLYTNIFLPMLDNVIEGAYAGEEQSALLNTISAATSDTTRMIELFNTCMNNKIEDASDTVSANAELARRTLIIISAVLLASVIAAGALSLYISGMISRPLIFMSGYLDRVRATGDLRPTPEEASKLEECRGVSDEIGRSVASCGSLIERIAEYNRNLGKVADGDLTVRMDALSERDGMSLALNKMVSNLSDMLGEIHTATEQVSRGAEQIAKGAQTLANGSSEQAASTEEFSLAVTALDEKIKYNSMNTDKANEANNKAGLLLLESMKSMEKTLEAMKAIDESSREITKVIGVIDDIAFQTNILSLNAAVEAARAGQHGKGFAVVAEEVRNLSAKSAESAKETAGLIEQSSRKVNEGRRTVESTNEGLKRVIVHANEAIALLESVAKASAEQTKSTEELSRGIGQISDVVHANSATAQQAAAAADEVSTQTAALNRMTLKFTLENNAKTPPPVELQEPARQHMPPLPATNALSFGKY